MTAVFITFQYGLDALPPPPLRRPCFTSTGCFSHRNQHQISLNVPVSMQPRREAALGTGGPSRTLLARKRRRRLPETASRPGNMAETPVANTTGHGACGLVFND